MKEKLINETLEAILLLQEAERPTSLRRLGYHLGISHQAVKLRLLNLHAAGFIQFRPVMGQTNAITIVRENTDG